MQRSSAWRGIEVRIRDFTLVHITIASGQPRRVTIDIGSHVALAAPLTRAWQANHSVDPGCQIALRVPLHQSEFFLSFLGGICILFLDCTLQKF